MFLTLILVSLLASTASSMERQGSTGFTMDSSVRPYAVSLRIYRSRHPASASVTAAAFVVDRLSEEPRILLMHRASRSEQQPLWETPSSPVSPADRTIVHGLVHSLARQTALGTRRVSRFISHYPEDVHWTTSTTLNFLIEPARRRDGSLQVDLSSGLYQDYVWVTETDVRRKFARRRSGLGLVRLAFRSEKQEWAILEAFEILRPERGA